MKDKNGRSLRAQRQLPERLTHHLAQGLQLGFERHAFVGMLDPLPGARVQLQMLLRQSQKTGAVAEAPIVPQAPPTESAAQVRIERQKLLASHGVQAAGEQ